MREGIKWCLWLWMSDCRNIHLSGHPFLRMFVPLQGTFFEVINSTITALLTIIKGLQWSFSVQTVQSSYRLRSINHHWLHLAEPKGNFCPLLIQMSNFISGNWPLPLSLNTTFSSFLRHYNKPVASYSFFICFFTVSYFTIKAVDIRISFVSWWISDDQVWTCPWIPE